jgi:2C-methyl-D-erythritol 2,4-cyclodiphosphate synthase
MEYANKDDLLQQLEYLVEEIRVQLNNLDQTLHAEIETLQSQINNLRN